MLGGDRRHQGLGAVAARHAEQVGAVPDGLPGQLADVLSVQQQHPGAERLGLRHQVELLDLAAAGLRVHDQHRPGGPGGRGLPDGPLLAVLPQGLRRGGHRPGPERHGQQGGHAHPAVHQEAQHPDRCRHREHHAEQPGGAPVGQCPPDAAWPPPRARAVRPPSPRSRAARPGSPGPGPPPRHSPPPPAPIAVPAPRPPPTYPFPGSLPILPQPHQHHPPATTPG